MSTDPKVPASLFADELSDDSLDESEIRRLILEGLAPLELPPDHQARLRGRLLARVGDSQRRHAGLVTVRAGGATSRLVCVSRPCAMARQVPQCSSSWHRERRCRCIVIVTSRKVSSSRAGCNWTISNWDPSTTT